MAIANFWITLSSSSSASDEEEEEAASHASDDDESSICVGIWIIHLRRPPSQDTSVTKTPLIVGERQLSFSIDD